VPFRSVLDGLLGTPVGDDHAGAGGLGPVHRKVRVVQQLAVVCVGHRVGLGDGHADAGAEHDTAATGDDVRGGGDGPPRRVGGGGRVGAVDEQEELVALQPGGQPDRRG